MALVSLAAGCASTPTARNFQGNVVALGTPVTVTDYALDGTERIALERKLRVLGLVTRHGVPSEYRVEARHNSRSMVYTIALLKEGVPLVMARNQAVIGHWSYEMDQHAFAAALQGFERAYFMDSTPVP